MGRQTVQEDWEFLKPGIEPMEGDLQALVTSIKATEARFWAVVSMYYPLGLIELRQLDAPLTPLLIHLFSMAVNSRPFEMAISKKRRPEAEDVMLTR